MKFWYKKRGLLAQLLRPLSWIYRLIMMVRRFAYRCHILPSSALHIPIIVVGNITVGGTGKTPLVIAIARWLSLHQIKVGIISRGYGGEVGNTPHLVTDACSPYLVGDEAILIARESGCPVVVGSKRVLAARNLLQNHDCDIILSDDGLQHYALKRDIEINLIDDQRGYGNGLCLPAGPLREPTSRSSQVHFNVYNTAHKTASVDHANRFYMQLNPGLIYHLHDSKLRLDPKIFTTEYIHAVAGIGNPGRFFDLLRVMGFKIIEHVFPDHYQYEKKDLDFNDEKPIIMTEKDAVKCYPLKSTNIWILPIEAELSELFWERLLFGISKAGVTSTP